MNKLMIYLSMTAGLWLLMLPDSNGAYESTGSWFETEDRCRYIGADLAQGLFQLWRGTSYEVNYGMPLERLYLCVESIPTE